MIFILYIYTHGHVGYMPYPMSTSLLIELDIISYNCLPACRFITFIQGHISKTGCSVSFTLWCLCPLRMSHIFRRDHRKPPYEHWFSWAQKIIFYFLVYFFTFLTLIPVEIIYCYLIEMLTYVTYIDSWAEEWRFHAIYFSVFSEQRRLYGKFS